MPFYIHKPPTDFVDRTDNILPKAMFLGNLWDLREKQQVARLIETRKKFTLPCIELSVIRHLILTSDFLKKS